MKTLARFVSVAALAVCATLLAQNYQIDWYTIDGGGGTSSGGTYELSGTIGQPDATTTTLTGGSYSLQGGFWPGLIVPSTGESPTLFIQIAAPNSVTVSWAPATPGFQLEQTDDLNGDSWSPAPTGNPVELPADASTRFYRLRQ